MVVMFKAVVLTFVGMFIGILIYLGTIAFQLKSAFSEGLNPSVRLELILDRGVLTFLPALSRCENLPQSFLIGR